MVGPDLNKPGGVSSYCSDIMPQMDADVSYFVRGSRNDHNLFQATTSIIIDYILFFFTLVFKSHDFIFFHTSLGKNNLLRDSPFLIMSKLLQKKTLLYIHGWDEDLNFTKYYYFLKTFFFATEIIVLASSFKRKLIALGYTSPIHVSNTIYTDQLDSFIDNFSTNNENGTTISFLSRIENEKGVFITLEACNLLLKNELEINLQIAGSGSKVHKLEQVIKSIGSSRIVFLNHITGEEKFSFLAKTDILLFPTYHGEGLPIVIVEAMRAGAIIITRPVGGITDFFVDGEMGVLTQSLEPIEYEEIIRDLLNNPKKMQHISNHNKKYAKTHFSPQAVNLQLNKIFKFIVDNP
jgi:glycosyltransferase involved in cell wall biosynthesis